MVLSLVLLLAKGDDRVDASSAESGNVASGEGYPEKYGGDGA